jgi:hypothetical protein
MKPPRVILTGTAAEYFVKILSRVEELRVARVEADRISIALEKRRVDVPSPPRKDPRYHKLALDQWGRLGECRYLEGLVASGAICMAEHYKLAKEKFERRKR